MIASLHRMRARKEAVALSAKVGQLTEVGKFSEAIPVAQQALASWETAAGPDDAEVATALFRLAELYRELDRSADAEPLYVRSLAIREQVLGPDHPDVAELLYNLARLYKNQRREAE
jgi:hypothetical protein